MAEKELYGDGERWVVALRYEEPYEAVSRVPIEAMNVTVGGEPVEFGPATFVVVDANNLDRQRGGEHETGEEAVKAAQRFNREDLERDLDPEYAERRKRLKRLAPDFNRYYTGPSKGRWPERPGKYLVHDWGVGWHPEDSFTLVATLAEVEAEIAGGEANVGKVVDLDTGEEVAFECEVVVRFSKT